MPSKPLALLATIILFVSCSLALVAQPPSNDELVAYAVQSGEKLWRSTDPPKPDLASRELFTYALALCQANTKLDRLDRLFSLARQMQDLDPASKGYGNFRWSWAHPRVIDFNAVDFCMQGGSLIWLKHRQKLSPATAAQLKQILDLALQGCLRHKVNSNYTNIALMNAGDLIILGETLGDAAAAQEGYARLDRACLYIWDNGIHEYCSPTYYGVDLDCLQLIEAFCQREHGKTLARALLQLFWQDIANNFFPPSQKLAGARSRDYDYLRGLGMLDTQLWLSGWLDGGLRGAGGVIFPAQATWHPDPKRLAYSGEHFPRLVRQSWGEADREFRTHYLTADITLSSSGANYHTMDLPLTVDLPGDRNNPRSYFIPDGRHDPYGKIKIAESEAHQKTIHLRPFFAAAQRRVDAVGLVAYRPKDVPAGTTSLESHWVFPRQVDALWVGGKKIDLSAAALAIVVNPKDAVVYQKGTAAVGLRIPWTRGSDGKEAPVSLVYDGNTFGVLRLTIDHRAPAANVATAIPAAMMWVRIGSGLKDPQSFDLWRTAFSVATAQPQIDGDHLAITAQGVDGPVTVAANSPFADCEILDPPPSRVVLEVDGQDIGRKLLAEIEPVKSYLVQAAAIPLIKVTPGGNTYWEAESGSVLPQMIRADDPAASGGKYVWMPGEPGQPGGGPGSVTWNLDLPQPADYYLWGRVLTPTPSDDSFNVIISRPGQPIIPLSAWQTGVHTTWQWTRIILDPAKTPGALKLPAGTLKLQVRVREDGAKLDRLFITTNPKQQPQ